jgi:Ca2+-binding RTX toxin-like protein
LTASAVQAEPVSETDIIIAAKNWVLQNDGNHFGEKIGKEIAQIARYNKSAEGEVDYYLITFEPNGWLIVPTDDDFWPIQSFGSGYMRPEFFEKTIWHKITHFKKSNDSVNQYTQYQAQYQIPQKNAVVSSENDKREIRNNKDKWKNLINNSRRQVTSNYGRNIFYAPVVRGGPYLSIVGLALAITGTAWSKRGTAKKFLLLALTAATLAVLVNPATAASTMLQSGFAELTGYSDITNFAMDGLGRLYVVKDKSSPTPTLVRFDRFMAVEDTATFDNEQGSIEEITVTPKGEFIYYRNSVETNVVYSLYPWLGYGYPTTFSTPAPIERMSAVSENTVLVAWHSEYDDDADHPQWLPSEIQIGMYRTDSANADFIWTWNPDWQEDEVNFDGDPAIGRIGNSWDYKIAYSLTSGVVALTEHYKKFLYEPTGNNHYSGVVTNVYRNSNTNMTMTAVSQTDYPDWAPGSLEPVYTVNGALLYRSHPDYEGHPNLIDAIYAADQGTKEVLSGKYVEAWDESDTTVRIDDVWTSHPGASRSITMQYMADYQGDIVIARNEKNADTGEILSLKLIKFTPAAAVGETFIGTSGADNFTNTPGHDYFYGDSGNDVYHWGIGDGNDLINDYSLGKGGRSSETGTLEFGAGIAVTDIDILHDEADVIFLHKPTGATLTVVGWMTGSQSQFTSILFTGSGQEFTNSWVNEFPPAIYGTEYDDVIAVDDKYYNIQGEDRIFGYAGDDVIAGGALGNHIEAGPGNDYVIGGGGQAYYSSAWPDEYIWRTGDGKDLINDYSWWKYYGDEIHFLRFPDLGADEVEYETAGSDLKILVSGTSDYVRVMNWYNGLNFQLNYIKFEGNGEEIVNRDFINSQLFGIVQGTYGDDTLTAYAGDTIVNGETGSDVINVYGGGHIIRPGEGLDTIYFQTAADPGDPNVVTHGVNDGNVDIYGEYDGCVIAFGEGIPSVGLGLSIQGTNLKVTVPPYDALITFHDYAPNRVGRFTFGNGTIWEGSEVDAIADGTMTAFSFSMTEVAKAFVESVEKEEAKKPEEEAKKPEDGQQQSGISGSNGCDTGAGAALLLLLFAVGHCRKRKRRSNH